MALRFRTAWTGQGAIGGGVSTMVFAGEDQTAADAANAALTTFWQAVEPNIDSDTVWTVENEVDVFNPATGLNTGVLVVGGFTGNGNAVGDMSPIATQMLVRWRTGQFIAGREIRGRTFIPGIGEGLSGTDGRPTTPARTTLQNAASALVSGSDLQIFSPTHLTVATVTLASVWTEFAVLRSRRD